jgi:hypothetical protein
VVLVGGGQDVEETHQQNAIGTSGQETKSVNTIAYDQRTRLWSDSNWAPLSHPREGLAAVALRDGRVFTLGGWGQAEDQSGSASGSTGARESGLTLRSDLRITEVSACDGSGWVRTANMYDARTNPAVRHIPVHL